MSILPKFVALVVLVASALAGELDCARTYTVKHGDDCNSISATQNVSTFQLAHANPEINVACSNLVAGQTLCLGMTGHDCTKTTVVRSGDMDTCAAIATAAGIPLSLLLENNPNINPICDNIYPGEVLCTANDLFDQSFKCWWC